MFPRIEGVYISNSHPKDMFDFANSINQKESIQSYSKIMIEVSNKLETELYNNGFPVINKDNNKLPTHHIWACFKTKEECYKVFSNLEQIGILVNYRLLPYNLGYGLRIGVNAAIQQGLRTNNIFDLSLIMSCCYKKGYSYRLKNDMNDLFSKISKNGKFI